MQYILCMLFAYGIGSINPAYIIGKIKGFDIRKKGSKNAGASNALIILGKTTGVICALFDIGKSCIAIWLSQIIFTDIQYVFPIAGTLCVIGHMFPFYMGFKGGKGTASLGGVIIMLDWRIFIVFFAVEIIIVFISDYLCFMPITAVIIYPVLYGIVKQDFVGAFIFLGITIPVLIKNIENIKRMLNGTEMHLSFLWNKDKEIARVTADANTDIFESEKGEHHE
ncbi:MAG: glycerol-3-phosphate acyltransferase [Clostridia bacterium]|nr:glycerol-3-phosphate acyltransferase [Clostridia bacterium]